MKLTREILRLALPSILANITVPLVGMVDIAIAGHLGASGYGAAALIGGISVGSMLFDVLYWNFAFLRTGTGGLTAQAYGAGSDTGHILIRALHIALLSGLALIAVQWLVIQGAFLVVKCTPEVRELAIQYFRIRIWAAPATLSLFAFKGWFIGMQDSVRPMTADLLVNGINIAASVLLALGLGGSGGFFPDSGGILAGSGAILRGSATIIPALGFRGIALGTVIAQWSGFAYCVAAILHRYRHHFTSPVLKNGQIQGCEAQNSAPVLKNSQKQGREAQNNGFFALNRDLFLRSVGMVAVYIGFTVISAGFGDMMLAVSTIIMKLLMIFSYFTDGFAYAGEALTGRFIGEKSQDGVHSTVKQTFAWGAGVALLFMAVYGMGGTWLFSLMTSDTSVIDAGRQFIPWLLLMPAMGIAAFVWDGIFIGATAGRELRNSTLLCAIGFFGVWFAGRLIVPDSSPETAIHILMGAYFTHLAIRTVYLTARARKAIGI